MGNVLGLYRDNGKQNGNYHNGVIWGCLWGCIGFRVWGLRVLGFIGFRSSGFTGLVGFRGLRFQGLRLLRVL